jgi:hypothetical protein
MLPMISVSKDNNYFQYELLENIFKELLGKLSISSFNQNNDFFLFDACASIDKELLNVYYLPLVFIVSIIITTIFMSQDSTNVSTEDLSDTISNPLNLTLELSLKMIHQLRHNYAHPNERYTYRNFPEGHAGHLDLRLRIKLVSIMRSSMHAPLYRYGSSLGTFYNAGTYDAPTATPEMAGIVLSAELNPNWVYR